MKKKLKDKIINLILKAIAGTWKIDLLGSRVAAPAVVMFWHNKMMPVWKYFSTIENAVGIVSKSKDGGYIANLLESWRYGVIRGSSSDDPKIVMGKMTEAAGNSIILITPDGPKGPIYKLKAGAVVAAARAGVHLQYLNVEISRKKVFTKSWDRFEFPYPFSKIRIIASEPIMLKSDDREYINDKIAEIEKLMQKN